MISYEPRIELMIKQTECKFCQCVSMSSHVWPKTLNQIITRYAPFEKFTLLKEGAKTLKLNWHWLDRVLSLLSNSANAVHPILLPIPVWERIVRVITMKRL